MLLPDEDSIASTMPSLGTNHHVEAPVIEIPRIEQVYDISNAFLNDPIAVVTGAMPTTSPLMVKVNGVDVLLVVSLKVCVHLYPAVIVDGMIIAGGEKVENVGSAVRICDKNP